jgi:hypothetical protein
MKYGLGDSCGLLALVCLSRVITHILQDALGGGAVCGRKPYESGDTKSYV